MDEFLRVIGVIILIAVFLFIAYVLVTCSLMGGAF
jgi:hypothetical protein